jgi:homoserine trans-succinylase
MTYICICKLTQKKTLEINFLYLVTKKLTTFYDMLHNLFNFPVQIILNYLINHVLKFKHQTGHLKVNTSTSEAAHQ